MKRNILWLLPPIAVIVLMMALAFQPTREEQAMELFVRDRAALEELLSPLYLQKETSLWASLMEKTKRRKGGAA